MRFNRGQYEADLKQWDVFSICIFMPDVNTADIKKEGEKCCCP